MLALLSQHFSVVEEIRCDYSATIPSMVVMDTDGAVHEEIVLNGAEYDYIKNKMEHLGIMLDHHDEF